MEKSAYQYESQSPKNWSDLLGPFTKATDLDRHIRETRGLILLHTKDATEVCPIFQFDKDEAGQTRVNPHVALAWTLLSALQIAQLGESSWSKAGMLAQPRPEYGGSSWVDILIDVSLSDTEKMPVYAAIVGDAVYASQWDGSPLIDPRTILPK